MSRALRLAFSLGICAAASWAEPVPRPISAAERAAVELVLAYAERGAAAWVERRAAGSWLGALPAAEAAAEIAARCGPGEAAHWRLQTPAASFGPETAIFTIESARGIGQATIQRVAGPAPKRILLRFHLRGLEEMRLVYGDTATILSIASVGDGQVFQTLAPAHDPQAQEQPITPDGLDWMQTRIAPDSDEGKPSLPLENGYIEVELPNRFLLERHTTFTLRWIDFYR